MNCVEVHVADTDTVLSLTRSRHDMHITCLAHSRLIVHADEIVV